MTGQQLILSRRGKYNMFGPIFGHGTLRKYVIYFGTLFNNIRVRRFDSAGNAVQTFKVPLNYGPREKFLARLEGNPDFDRPIAVQLPRMTFEMTGIYYDPSRKLNALNKISAPTIGSGGQTAWQYQPVPYNINFTLSIMVKNVEDGTYIVEQILPYFNPVWTATLNINPDVNQKYDVPITLDNITSEDTYEGNFETRRAIIWTLTFTMKGYFFGPTRQATGEIIREIDLNFRTPGIGVEIPNANTTNSGGGLSYEIKPGQYANGEPVTYYNDTRLRSYTLSNASGIFIPTEKISVNANNYLYAASSNTSTLTARRIVGNIANGSILTGEITGHTATITNIEVIPEDSANNLTIAANSDYGFIYDITENL